MRKKYILMLCALLALPGLASAQQDDVLTPPFNEDFSSADNFSKFIVVDANNDGTTWELNDEWYPSCAQIGTSENGNDDWLVTPALKLNAGVYYKLSFKAMATNHTVTRTLEAVWGEGNNPMAFTDSVLPKTNLEAEKYTTYEKIISTSTDKVIRIAFHDITADDGYTNCRIDDISLVSVSNPDSVTMLTVTPAPKGKAEATIHFLAPEKNLGGVSLDSLSKLVVLRDGTSIVASIDNPAPSSEHTVTDTNVPSGTHTYTVFASNDAGQGRHASASCYVGMDVPVVASANPRLVAVGQELKIVFNNVDTIGENGGYVDPDSVSFTVNASTEDVTKGDVLADSISGLYFTTDIDPSVGEQRLVRYFVSAFNAAGRSSYGYIQTVVGEPVNLPLKESFAGGQAENFFWTNGDINVRHYPMPSANDASDDDGGCLYWDGYSTTYEACSPKFSVSDDQTPVLTFDYYAEPKSASTLDIYGGCPDGNKILLATIDNSTLDGESGWRSATVDCSPLKGYDYAYLIARMSTTERFQVFKLDNFWLFNQQQDNLVLMAKGPETVKMGEFVALTARIFNHGTNTASNYTISLYKGNDKIVGVAGPAVEALDTTSVSLSYQSNAADPDTLQFRVKVDYAADQNSSDNESALRVALVRPGYPVVVDLMAEPVAKGVRLNWTTPELAQPYSVSEDFEQFTPWQADNFGNWTMRHDDNSERSMSPTTNYPNSYENFAAQVYNPYDGSMSWGWNMDTDVAQYPQWIPNGGEQALMCPVASVYWGATDRWIISPQLSGAAQTITFYAAETNSNRGPEKVELLYSTGGVEDTDFQLVREQDVETVGTGAGSWQQITFDVPEGARWFAIHHTNNGDGECLLLDDFSYEAVPEGPTEILGYRIYRDSVLVDSVDNVVEYVDSAAGVGHHVWNISVVYPEGESQLSNNATAEVTSVALNKMTEQHRYNVYTLDGRAVRLNAMSLSGLRQGIYVINGKKTLVR